MSRRRRYKAVYDSREFLVRLPGIAERVCPIVLVLVVILVLEKARLTWKSWNHRLATIYRRSFPLNTRKTHRGRGRVRERFESDWRLHLKRQDTRELSRVCETKQRITDPGGASE